MLEVRQLVVNYGPVRALHGVSLAVPEGRLVCVIGSNGAGKTTLLRTISGLVRPVSGEVHLAGTSLLGRSPNRIPFLGVAHCPEGRRVFPDQTVEDNLVLGAYARLGFLGGTRRITADLDNSFAIFPRLKERRTQLAGTLSGGEQQMLAVARALMSKPKVLLLDEPSMGLAPIIIDEVFATLKRLREQGVTMLLVEQLAYRALGVADYGYVIENGRILLEGRAADLMNDERVKAAYLGGGAAKK